MTRILVIATVVVLMLAIVAPAVAEQLDVETSEAARRTATRQGAAELLNVTGDDTTVLLGAALGILTMAILGQAGEQRV